MKYKMLAFATLFLFSYSTKFYAQFGCCTTCIDLSKGTTGLYALLESMWPSHTIIGESSTTPTAITAGGSYQIMENTNASIQILADDVILDLNGFTLYGEFDPLVLIGEGQKNIMIKNGSLEGNGDNAGIVICQCASTVMLQDLTICNCAVGMRLSGSECCPVTCCKVDNCFTTSCIKGFVLEFTEKTVFEHCEACCCQESGFDLYGSRFNKFKDCMAIGIGNADPEVDAFGYTSVGGFDNLFYECFAENIHKDGTAGSGIWCKKAIGFNLGFPIDCNTSLLLTASPEMESKIIKCLVDSIETPTCSWYHAMGIRLDSVVPLASIQLPGIGARFLTENHIPVLVDWSPRCNFIAFGEREIENGSGFKLIKFDGKNLLELNMQDLGEPVSLEFSPNGRFILFTQDAGSPDLSIYDIEKRMVVATADQGLDTPYASWLNCSNRIILSGANGTSFFIYAFDGATLSLVREVSDIGIVIGDISISPDDKIMAVSEVSNSNTLFFVDLNSFALSNVVLDGAGSNASFNPLVCCGKYYIASLDDENTLHVNFYNSDMESFAEVAILVSNGGGLIRDFAWHPTGKYLAVSRSGETGDGLVQVYRFDPQAGPALQEPPIFEYDGTLVDAQNYIYIDWSPCGNYVVILGEPKTRNGSGNIDFEIIEIGNCVKCCVVDSNKVANSVGGRCSIGFFGASCCNGITRNVGYGNCINFSQGIYNKYCNGLSGTHSLLGNWSIPPY